MTPDELREKVRATVQLNSKCHGYFALEPGEVCLCQSAADAAIDVVLEEAAKVCETNIESERDAHGRYFAAAIRALIRTAS